MKTLETFFTHNETISAFYTLRKGGFSTGNYGGLNLGLHVGDNKKNVEKNRAYLQKNLEGCQTLQSMQQVHKTKVCCVDDRIQIPKSDALITQTKGVALMVMVADCIPVLFFDRVNRVVAAVHAGRAGCFDNIVRNTLEKMGEHYGCKPENISVSMGPSIGACCYEVGQKEVDEALVKGFQKAIQTKGTKFYLDLKSIVLHQLKEEGIMQKLIQNHEVCTACNTKDYYSYRKEGETGRFCGVIMLK